MSDQTDTTDTLLERASQVASLAALEVGQYLLQKQGRVEVVKRKGSHDELLDADLIAEELILSKLRTNFPDHEILSEEAPPEHKATPYRWVVDPLDGSYNFQHGSPLFATSISFVVNDVPTVGVIYLPLLDKMFTAIRGRGAELNRRPIHVSRTSQLGDSIVHVGDFAKDGNTKDNQEVLHNIANLAGRFGRVRMIGTAATDLAYVACGLAEAVVIHNALPWDVQVGCLLVEEAGGKVDFLKSPSGKELVVGSNGFIHEELLRLIPQERITGPLEYGSLQLMSGTAGRPRSLAGNRRGLGWG
jgi:myo-inositol-1(or 4)-monophosphatase